MGMLRLGCAQLHGGGFLLREMGEMLPGLVTPPRTTDAVHPQTQFVKTEPAQPPGATRPSARGRLSGLELALGAWTNHTSSTKKPKPGTLHCSAEFYGFFHLHSPELPSQSATEPNSASTLLRITYTETHYLIGICLGCFLVFFSSH